MEPVVATGRDRSQIAQARNRRNQAKSVAVGCHRLPQRAHGVPSIQDKVLAALTARLSDD
jgi:hypothetical protein